MKVVVISPEHADPREAVVLGDLFAAGLERYHVRKPTWSRTQLESWLRQLPVEWRSRLVLHQHHELAKTLGLGGLHWRDQGTAGIPPVWPESLTASAPPPPHLFTSRSCHDLPTLRASLGRYDSVFFGPVFPSLSKPGYGPRDDLSFAELAACLSSRRAAERRTTVLALGGITAERIHEVRTLGFDGIAVIGAIWQAADPARAFAKLLSEVPPASCRPSHPDTDGKPALLATRHA